MCVSRSLSFLPKAGPQEKVPVGCQAHTHVSVIDENFFICRDREPLRLQAQLGGEGGGCHQTRGESSSVR